MSFLEPNIFIPRKDNIVGLSCEESDRALRTNWLTIERFLNQGLWSAAMSQSTAQPVGAANNGVEEILTHWTSQWTARSSAVDIANSRFVLPATGIYQATVGMALFWNSTSAASGFADQAFGAVIVSSSAATPPFVESLSLGYSAAEVQVIATFKCSATPCYVRAGATIATLSTHAPTNGTAQASYFSVVRIGSIPSAVQ